MLRHIITERDLAILRSIGEARVLTNREVEWLHFPGWERREQAHAARNPKGDIPYNPASSVRMRLNHLLDIHLLTVVPRVLHQVRRQATRLPYLYALTATGKAYLSEELADPDIEQLWAYTGHVHSVQNLEHSYLIGRTYAALAVAAQRDGQQLSHWLGDHILSQDYDRMRVVGFPSPLPVLPDATGLLTTGELVRRFFVELDRGTMAAHRWREKAAAQQVYRGSAALRERYDVADFFTLVVCANASRLQRIAEAVIREARAPNYAFLFTAVDQLHPATIRRCWQRISAVLWDRQPRLGRLVEMPRITWAPVGLWKPPQHPPDKSPDGIPQGDSSEAV